MRVLTLGAICSLLLAPSALAQPAPPQPWLVVVAEPVVIGIDPASATTFADLVRVELGKRAGLRVIPRSNTPQDPCGDAACAADLARRAGAAAAVASTLSRL